MTGQLLRFVLPVDRFNCCVLLGIKPVIDDFYAKTVPKINRRAKEKMFNWWWERRRHEFDVQGPKIFRIRDPDVTMMNRDPCTLHYITSSLTG